MSTSPGRKFRNATKSFKPLQVVGTINAYAALMAQKIGFHAIYLSGAGVANSSYGLPDLGLTTLDNVLEDVQRITAVVDLPLLVDIDTGWGSALMIDRTIKAMIRAGAAAVHIEDQVFHKRCGHRPKKALVSTEEMVDRIKAAVDARTDSSFVIMARTDAFASEGLSGATERALAYKEAGADMLFPEALPTLDDYRLFKKAVKIPVLANLTEFGQTPLFTRQELSGADIDLILYPLSVNRAMNRAAEEVFETILKQGTQRRSISDMQTRDQLYDYLDYQNYEKKLDNSYTDSS